MAKNETKRIRPTQVQTNKDDFANLRTITRYAPANPDYAVDKIQASENKLDVNAQLEAQANVAAKNARDNAVGSEWEHHNLMLGARDQIVAQFGRDSNEAQAVGLKKKSEYKSPGRKGKKGDSTK